jgi:hypothetical protein
LIVKSLAGIEIESWAMNERGGCRINAAILGMISSDRIRNWKYISTINCGYGSRSKEIKYVGNSM